MKTIFQKALILVIMQQKSVIDWLHNYFEGVFEIFSSLHAGFLWGPFTQKIFKKANFDFSLGKRCIVQPKYIFPRSSVCLGLPLNICLDFCSN